MYRRSLFIGIIAAACGLLATAAPARAASSETWVSPNGSDAGGCPVTAPCKTFNYAHGQTTSGGAINVLSPGNFGPLTITKSISIVADGAEAVINTAAGGAAIKINAPDSVVSLRGLTIEGVAGGKGLSFIAGAVVHVQNCVIRGGSYGISVAPASGKSELHVSDSAIANTSSFGMEVRPTGSGSAEIVLDRVRVENSASTGIRFTGNFTTGAIKATVRDSVSAGHTSTSIHAQEDGSGTTAVMVDRTASVNNGTGIFAEGAGATIRIGNSTVNGNTRGLDTATGGAIRSYGTNKVAGNTSTGVPTSTIAMK